MATDVSGELVGVILKAQALLLLLDLGREDWQAVPKRLQPIIKPGCVTFQKSEDLKDAAAEASNLAVFGIVRWRVSLRNFTNVECVGGKRLTRFREVSAWLSQRVQKSHTFHNFLWTTQTLHFLTIPQKVRFADTLSETEGRTVSPYASLLLLPAEGPKAVAAEIGYWTRMSLQLSAYCS
jgi:hypothetical protein